MSGMLSILAVKVDLDAEISNKVGERVILLPSNRTSPEAGHILVLANFIQV